MTSGVARALVYLPTVRSGSRVHSAAGVAALAAYAAALVVLRGSPRPVSDKGVFLSVAARLADGDRLYVDVWDNKPPLFYYVSAASFEFLGWRGPFLVDVAFIVLAAAGLWLLLRAIGTSLATRLAGVVAMPLLLTDAWYFSGCAELRAVALAPVVGSLWLRGHPFAAGVALGLSLSFRPDYFLVLLAVVLAPAAVLRPDRRTLARSLGLLAVGVAAIAIGSAMALAALGELGAFLETARNNLGYPDRALIQEGFREGIPGHVAVLWHILGVHRGSVFLVAVVLASAAAVVTLVRARSGCRHATPAPILAALVLATTLATAITLALNALWSQNLEFVALPGALVACLIVCLLEGRVRRTSLRIASFAVAGILCLFAFGGVSMPGGGSDDSHYPLSDWFSTPESATAAALEEAAGDALSASHTVTYARLGTNTDGGHAAFLGDGFKLICPLFHQYSFSNNLEEAEACIRQRRPELIVVDSYFAAKHKPASRSWDDFVARSLTFLHDDYRLVVSRAGADAEYGGHIEVWQRRSVPP